MNMCSTVEVLDLDHSEVAMGYFTWNGVIQMNLAQLVMSAQPLQHTNLAPHVLALFLFRSENH